MFRVFAGDHSAALQVVKLTGTNLKYLGLYQPSLDQQY